MLVLKIEDGGRLIVALHKFSKYKYIDSMFHGNLFSRNVIYPLNILDVVFDFNYRSLGGRGMIGL